ncbi:MAG: hypothetical protein Q3971_04430 [Moraxella sp.]|nr:hypothetical protein [Moraxella sp.]
MKFIKALSLSFIVALGMPAYAMTCYYSTHIDDDDLYNSSGKKLTTVGQILRQDRTNLYTKAGENDHDGHDWDNCRLDIAKQRESLQRIIDKAKISPTTKKTIKQGGGVPIRVEITKGVASVHVIN